MTEDQELQEELVFKRFPAEKQDTKEESTQLGTRLKFLFLMDHINFGGFLV